MISARRIFCIILALCGFVCAQTNAVPFVNAPLTPMSTAPGSSGFQLTVNGTDFVSASVVNWNGSPRATTFVSASQLQATILSTDVANAETANITVTNPVPGGGISNAASFNVTFASPSVGFTASTTNETTNCASSVQLPQIVADFNGDGKQDVAGSICSGGFIYVALGNGDGTFQAAIKTAITPFYASSFVAADFNGDGKIDLAFIDDSNIVGILLGNGDGTFQPIKNFLTSINPGGLAIGDVNGDGKMDLVVTSVPDNTVDVLLGNGDGTFQPFIASSTGGVDSGALVLGDFNSDGKLDVAVTEGNSDEVTVMLGNGDGTFTYNQDYFVAAYYLATVDLNNDGHLDLLGIGTGLGGGEVGIVLLIGNGDGTFQTPIVMPLVGASNYSTVGAADLNGDGKIDLWALGTLSNGAGIAALLGNGDGTFQSPINYAPTAAPQGPIVEGDFNNDGKADFVVRSDSCTGLYCTEVLLQTPVVASPTSLAFGTKLIKTRTKAQSVTVTNSGTAAYTISKISFTGTYAADYSQTNDCPASLASDTSCTIQVVFDPKSEDISETASLTITDTAPGGSQTVTLTGEGTYIRETPTSLSFGNIAVGQSSTLSATLTNTGTAALTVSKISVVNTVFSKEFKVANNCGKSLAAGAQCQVMVTFSPTSAGHAGAQIEVSFIGDQPPNIQATGNGT
jgi:hypothetical protein